MENNLEKEILSAVKGKNQENNVREMIGVYKMLKVFLKIPEKIEKDEKEVENPNGINKQIKGILDFYLKVNKVEVQQKEKKSAFPLFFFLFSILMIIMIIFYYVLKDRKKSLRRDELIPFIHKKEDD